MSDAIGYLLDFGPEALLRRFRASVPASGVRRGHERHFTQQREVGRARALGRALEEIGDEPRCLGDAPVGAGLGFALAPHVVGELPLGAPPGLHRGVHLRLALLRHARERAHRLGAEVAAVGLGGPLGREVLGNPAGQPLLTRNGLAGDLAARLPLDDGGLHVVDAHAGERGVLGAQAHGVAPERLGRGGALGHGERAGEVVRCVEQRHRPFVVDALYHAAGHPLRKRGRPSPAARRRPCADARRPSATSRRRPCARAAGRRGRPRVWTRRARLSPLGPWSRRRSPGGRRCRPPLSRTPGSARGCATRRREAPRPGEARGHLARRAHGTPRRRELRSRVRGGSPARRPPPASIASCPRRPCCSRG